MQNTNYGKPTVQGGIEYAPRKFVEDGNIIVPKIDDDEAYISRGWYKAVNVVPSYDPAVYTARLSGWMIDEELKMMTAIYDILPIPPNPTRQVKRFSKLKMTLFCMDRKLWNFIKKFLTKTGYYDLFVMAQYFLESDEYFKRGIAAFKEEFVKMGHTEEEYNTLVENMCNFALDGYETIDVPVLSSDQNEFQEDQSNDLRAQLSGDIGNEISALSI